MVENRLAPKLGSSWKALLATMVLVLAAGSHLLADDGQWVNIGPPGGYSVHALAIPPGSTNTIYAGTDRAGVFKSTDRGQTWAPTSGLGPGLIFALAVDPGAPHIVYAGTNTSGVFRSVDGGATWNALSHGLSTTYVRALVVAGSGTVYAGTDRGVFKTFRGGPSWTAANEGLADLYVVSLALDPTVPSTVYAGTASGVFKSANSGASWASTYGRAQQGILALAIAPSAPATVYAGTYYSGPSTGPPIHGDGILKSVDAGSTWASVNNGLPSNAGVHALAADTQSPSTVYAGVSYAGIFRSMDGSSWTPLAAGLTQLSVFAIAIDDQGAVYAGTGGGVFRLTKGSNSCTADSTALCLNGGRFRVQVQWRAPHIGTSGSGQAMPLTSDTGYFWFFTSNNVELVIKVVDGRPMNGHFWVFFGALSDVEYTISVTDTQTGSTETYVNPQGQLASVADTAAF